MAEETWNWDDVVGEVTPRSDVVPICLDGEVQRKLEHARRRLREAQRASDGTLDAGVSEIRAEVDGLEERAQAATREFTVRAIPHSKWRQLMVDHPSDEPGERYDPEKFIPAAIAACCPHFTSADQVAKAADDPDHGLTTGQVARLFRMARVLNEGDDRVPFSQTG